MAVKKCCVANCKSCSTRNEDKGVTFHKFPKDATSRNEWQCITHYRYIQNDLNAYVCSRHFCKADFQKNEDSKYILKSDAVPSIFPWTINKIKMDTSQSDSIEEPLSSFTRDDEKNISSGSQESQAENLDAIKKFIEEQEKEILQMELEEKKNQERKLQHLKEQEEITKKPLAQDKVSQEIDNATLTVENENIEKEPVESKFKLDNMSEIGTEQNLSSNAIVNDSSNSLNTTGDSNKGTNVMNMILPESDISFEQKDVENSIVTPKQSCKNDAVKNASDDKIMSPIKGSSTSLSVGCKVEVKSFEGDWYAAEVAEVDYDEMEVLIRYEVDLKRPDEWVSVSSPRLRPYTGNTTKPALPTEDLDDSSQEITPSKDTSKEEIKDTSISNLLVKGIKEEPKEEAVKIEEKPKLTFEVGERCLARWRDNRRFCATIHKDLDDGNYEIIFDDGFHWTCSTVRLHKMKADLSVDTSFQAATAGSPSPLPSGPGTSAAPLSPALQPAFHTHLFDPTRDYLGSKSERREKKRKLNIKEIFNIGQKKYKKQKIEGEVTPNPVAAAPKPAPPRASAPKPAPPRATVPKLAPPRATAPKKPRILRKNVTLKVPKVSLNKVKTEVPEAVASIIGTNTKVLEVKLETVDVKSIIAKSSNGEQLQTTDVGDLKEENKDDYDMDVDDVEPESCVVNPNDDTLDDEEAEEPKSEGDPVLEEEVILENFEKEDTAKHEEVIDKIKEAIMKLEGGITDIEKVKSPKVERTDSPVRCFEIPKSLNSPKVKLEVKAEDLKEALAEVVQSIEIGEPSADMKDVSTIEVKTEAAKAPKIKKEPSKMKKSKKLRLLQEKKVKRQVEKVKSELEEMKKQFEAMRKHMMSQEFVQGHENAPLPESFLFPGEWCCRWVNGQPVGRVSEIEGPPQLGVDNKPALPRRSVQVEDKRLPSGWTKHMVRRSVGHSAGKWDVVLVSSEEYGNKRFHTKTDMRNFLETNTDDRLKDYVDALLDFGVHLKISRRMGWIVNTPDGIAEGPETILPADTTCTLSPLVKRKNVTLDKRRGLTNRKRVLKIRKDKKRRPIKLKLQKGPHSYNSQLLSGESSSEINIETTEFEQPLMPLEDGYVYVGSLKVQIIENLLRCPAEGCFKNFRTKTLLQMHIKHYHRELKAMMGATPKVLDLAYARQRVMPNEMELTPDKKVIKVKINKPPKREEPRPVPTEPEMSLDIAPTPLKSENIFLPKIPRSQDSPKLRQALIHKPQKRPKVLLPVRRLETEQAISDTLNDEVFDSPIKQPIMEIPSLQHPLDFETAISTHTVTKPLDKKKKGDKKKSFASFSKNISEDEEWFAMNSDELDTRSSFPRSGSPDSKMMDSKLPPMSSESTDNQNLYTYTDTGERIKIVHMKREEIINCHCGVREEDGLMVQCELCLCWQHALCHNIQRECEVPEKYTCSICLNPRRGRRSRRFLHDQDRMYEGLLPGAAPCETLRRSHELSGNLVRATDALHALRAKLYVATKKDHPKLYLWAKDWEQAEISYTQEKLNSDYSDLNIMINGMDKENHPVTQDDGMDIRTPPSEDQESDRSSQRESQLGSQALLSGLLSSPGGASLDLPISTSELERLAKSVQESAEWQRETAPVPQPEAAIENDACRERLLKHIQRCHALIDTRLDSIEAQVAELESQDPSFGENFETAEYCPRTKQTIQMLMRDLNTMEELGVIT